MQRSQPTEKLLQEVTTCIELIVNDQKEMQKSRKMREVKELATNLPLKPVVTMTAGASVAVFSALSRKPNFYAIAAGMGTLLFGAKKLEDRLSQLKSKRKSATKHNLSPKIRTQVYSFLEAHHIEYNDCNIPAILQNLRVFQEEIKKSLAEKNELKNKKLAELKELASKSPAAAAALFKLSR
ncbi:MAG: hypothetical protein ACYCQI_08835 [Gammaproteobacteria bacterium]